jgi:CHRD domain
MSKLRLAIAALAALAGTGALLPATSGAADTTSVSTVMSGARVVPDDGDGDGQGEISVTLKPGRKRACFELRFANIGRPTAAYLRDGGNAGQD